MTLRCKALLATLSGGAALIAVGMPANALEGGTGAYILGSRDSFAGIVAPPGTTVITDGVWHLGAKGPTLSFSGIPVVNPKVDVFLNKFDVVHFFNTQFFGGTPGVSITIPYAGGSLTAGGPVAALVGGLNLMLRALCGNDSKAKTSK